MATDGGGILTFLGGSRPPRPPGLPCRGTPPTPRARPLRRQWGRGGVGGAAAFELFQTMLHSGVMPTAIASSDLIRVLAKGTRPRRDRPFRDQGPTRPGTARHKSTLHGWCGRARPRLPSDRLSGHIIVHKAVWCSLLMSKTTHLRYFSSTRLFDSRTATHCMCQSNH